MKISLIMAVYNGEKYLIKQLQSINNQTNKIDEVILIDDCSKDRSVEIVEEFIKENQGKIVTGVAAFAGLISYAIKKIKK